MTQDLFTDMPDACSKKRLPRRALIKLGALGMGGLLSSSLFRALAWAATQGEMPRETSVVWLWLQGGASQFETFDPKTDVPSEYRSVVGAIDTAIPGLRVAEHFPRIAKAARHMAFVHSFSHSQLEHLAASHLVMTGAGNPPGSLVQHNPSMGAITSKVRGAVNPRTKVPNFVRLTQSLGFDFDGPVWLGVDNSAFDIWRPETRVDLEPRLGRQRHANRQELRDALDLFPVETDNTGMMSGISVIDAQAADLIFGDGAQVFDTGREDPRLRERYGPQLGEQLLQARRLCEAGCGFVTMSYRGPNGDSRVPYAWDMHIANQPNNPPPMCDQYMTLLPMLDQAVSAFVEDVVARGLDRKILFVIASEFGRTPMLNAHGGRDHWSDLGPLVFAGGGLRMGQIVGRSSAKGEHPITRPIGPKDLMATIFHVLKINPNTQFPDFAGRPHYLLPDGAQPIAELI